MLYFIDNTWSVTINLINQILAYYYIDISPEVSSGRTLVTHFATTLNVILPEIELSTTSCSGRLRHQHVCTVFRSNVHVDFSEPLMRNTATYANATYVIDA